MTGLLCAAVFIGGLVFAGFLVPASAPENLPDTDPLEVQRHFLEHTDAARLRGFLQALAAVLLAAFTGPYANLARRADPESAGLSAAAVVGGALASAFLAVSALVGTTLAVEQITDSPALVGALRQVNFFTGGAAHTAWLGLLVGAVSAAARRGRALPGWLTTAGLVSAALSLLSLLSLLTDAAALFIPLGRFSGLLVIAAASVFMALGRAGAKLHAPPSPGASLGGGVSVVLLAFALTVVV
ncbi:hypothetical protein [Salinifilum ghardaiensis]